MLVLAASALTKIPAKWLNSLRGTLQNAQQSSPSKPLLDLDYLPFNDFANRNERDENDEISNSRDAFAAKGDVGDFQA